MAYLRNKKTLKLGIFSTEIWASKHIKRTSQLFSFKAVQSNIRFTFKATANTFNQYFCNIGPELAKKITPPTSAPSNFIQSCTSIFSLVDTSVEDVICGLDYIDYLKIGKALKVDDIPTKFLKIAKMS